ncbi:MAG: Aspartyl/glutamyl-tRNA(Asn/Gln) amidotransferase subunit C [Candidatus Yanofskybacteria bacterium GW2011_GWA1_39_13]|uniref:Aspartyl/glutamyl-tRNA(Asn/Gln) amidotransferase subunit C n=1 Tax=Yanofskybacteria sp. (strain GW2011_GWA1_39_13) TaxID=1619019 RepID=A0A0G0MHK6_YANXG|nr:MAG: Aspartyl/glutamyl-tRNA(Asn/Gln) amidotransferase subunit C [Candidatus Yanofskybacteria bacterium GW2011_GWA1_39_13]
MLTDKEVKHIAELARIKISEKEEQSLKKDLSSILEYINKLNEVDTTGVEPLYQTTGLVDSFRSDESRGEFKMDENLNEKLIGQAPHKDDRFIKVKSVLAHK